MEAVNAIGRRKAAIARVFVTEGNGTININKKDLSEYFPSDILQYVVKQPLKKLEVDGKYDINVSLKGGGFKGQAEALRLAISRALVKINPEDKPALKAEGFMTRDSRIVERKKTRSSQSKEEIPVQQALIF
jgi:small subunit ribosomal protein S9